MPMIRTSLFRRRPLLIDPPPGPIVLHIEPEVGDTALRLQVSMAVWIAGLRVDPGPPR